MNAADRKLRVFLCHASQDKPVVRELYQHLLAEGWIDPWLDEEKLLPGYDWDLEIEKAVENADAVIVCLSNNSVTKEGYVQRELKFVLEIALEKPEGTIFIIPIRLDNCQVPRRIRSWQYVDFFPHEQKEIFYQKLCESMRQRATSIGILDFDHSSDPEMAKGEFVLDNDWNDGIPIISSQPDTGISSIEIRLQIQEQMYILDQLRRIESKFVFRSWLREGKEGFDSSLEKELWDSVPKWEKVASYAMPFIIVLPLFIVLITAVEMFLASNPPTNSSSPDILAMLTFVGLFFIAPILIILLASFYTGSMRKKSITPILRERIEDIENRISDLRAELSAKDGFI